MVPSWCPKPPRFPIELVDHVIRHHDPFDDAGRLSLVAWTRVSRACWSTASKVLYRHLQVNRKRFVVLLRAYRRVGRRISPRLHPAFAMVERLPLIGPIGRAVIMLRDTAKRAARSGRPLFPNVRELALWAPPYQMVGEDRHQPPDLTRLPSIGDTLIFDRPDVCVEDIRNPDLLLYLPARGWGTMCYHRLRQLQVFGGQLPPERWNTLTLFSVKPFYEDNIEPHLLDRFRAQELHATIAFNTELTPIEGLNHRAIQNIDTADIFHIEWYDPEWLEDCPVCTICGEIGSRPKQ